MCQAVIQMDSLRAGGLSDGFRAQSYPITPFQPAKMFHCCVIISQIKRDNKLCTGAPTLN